MQWDHITLISWADLVLGLLLYIDKPYQLTISTLFKNIDFNKPDQLTISTLFKNIDINIDKVIFENIDMDKAILEHIDININKDILENIDVYKISNWKGLGISNTRSRSSVVKTLSLSKISRYVMRKRYTLFPRQEELRREQAPEIVMIRSVCHFPGQHQLG